METSFELLPEAKGSKQLLDFPNYSACGPQVWDFKYPKGFTKKPAFGTNMLLW